MGTYAPPTFNLTCRIRRFVAGPYPPGGPAGGTVVPCQLRGTIPQTTVSDATATGLAHLVLLVPKLTDVRMNSPAGPDFDLVECPNGSGLWYSVDAVWDVGKGFQNEHRAAAMNSMNAAPNMWVFPQP